MYKKFRSNHSNKSDTHSCIESELAGNPRRTWMSSLQLLACVVPMVDEKDWDDLPEIHDIQENNDNRLLSTRSMSSSSSSHQQERRQSASASSKAKDSQESRHKASPSRMEQYQNEFMTPPRSIPQNRELVSPYQNNNNEDMVNTKIRAAVTPEQHIDFIRGIFESDRPHELLENKSQQYSQRSIHESETIKTTNRILLPVLDESSPTARHEISLSMRRYSNPFHNFDAQYPQVRHVETPKLISSASGVLYEPGFSVRALARSPRAEIMKCTDEWRLLQEAKLEIASVKEFLRVKSIQNESNQEEEADIGIETLLLNDDHVAVMEDYPMEARPSPRRTSFGEKPPRPPHVPRDCYDRLVKAEF